MPMLLADAKPISITSPGSRYQQYANTIPTDGTVPWLVPSMTTIIGFKALQANWDGYGSPIVSREAIETAADLVESLANYKLPAPEIFPVSGGGIGIVFNKGGRELQIEMFPDGTPVYTKDSDLLADRPESETSGIVDLGRDNSHDLLAFWLLGF